MLKKNIIAIAITGLYIIVVTIIASSIVIKSRIEKLHTTDIELSLELAKAALERLELKSENKNLKHKLEILSSRFDIIDSTIDIDGKRKVRIKTIIEGVQATSKTNNPFEDCRARPTTGEGHRIASAVVEMSDRYAVSAALILAIIRQESMFCNTATSKAGAKGYMQLMPDTAAQVAADVGLPLKTWKGRDNIHLGTAYISQMLVDFGGNIELAVKAYNGGPHHVKRVLAGETENYYKETANYAIRVLDFKKEYEALGVN